MGRASEAGFHPASPERPPHKRANLLILILLLLCAGGAPLVRGQTGHGLAANVGVGVSNPVGQIADFVHWSGTLNAGIGYRFKEGQSALAQYAYFALPLRTTSSDSFPNLTPEARLFTLTGNYKIDFLRTRSLRPYLIAGGGWYRRVATIQRTSVIDEALCDTGIPWWDLACEVGTVSGELTVASSTLDVFGFNAGAGVSKNILKTSARWYAEIRYHYAPHEGVPTRIFPLVFGLSW